MAASITEALRMRISWTSLHPRPGFASNMSATTPEANAQAAELPPKFSVVVSGPRRVTNCWVFRRSEAGLS